MMKPGDIVTHYANPSEDTYPEQVILIRKVQDCGLFEQWWFSYLNESSLQHKGLFKKSETKQDGTI